MTAPDEADGLFEASDKEVLGALGASVDEVRPSPSLKATLLQAVASTDPVVALAGFAGRLGRLFDLPDAGVRDILRAVGSAEGWEPYLDRVTLYHFDPGPRVRAAGASQVDAGLVRFGAGMPYPRHRHLGDEYMFILSGGLVEDETGRRLVAGDFLHMAAGTEHGFRILPGEDCVAAVLLYDGLPEFV